MKWGTFGPVHLLSLLFAAGLVTGLYYLLKPTKKGVQIAVLGVLSFSGIAAILYNLLAWNAPVMYLPLHLCSINALLQLFYRAIPHQYWYMYMIIPILVIYLLAVYAPQYIHRHQLSKAV